MSLQVSSRSTASAASTPTLSPSAVLTLPVAALKNHCRPNSASSAVAAHSTRHRQTCLARPQLSRRTRTTALQ